MVDLERINYKGLYSDVVEFIDYSPLRYDNGASLCEETPISPLNIPVQNERMLRIKKLVKRTPMGRIIVSQRKRKYLRSIFTDGTKPKLDLCPLFEIEDMAYINHAFNILLDRDMTHDEFVKFYQMLKTGMPKEALIFILCNSGEINKNIAIESFTDYERAYFRYVYKQKVTNLPVISYLIALFTMPVRLKKLENYWAEMDIAQADRFNCHIHHILLIEDKMTKILEKISPEEDK